MWGMVAGIVFRISCLPIHYPEWKDQSTQDFKFACCSLWVQVSQLDEPEGKRPRIRHNVQVDGDNAKMDLKEV